MTESVKAVLFDVDGTLVDTNYLHAVAWWEAFAQAGHYVPMADIHHAIGMGSDKLLDALLQKERDTGQDDDIRTSHTALYSVYWSRLQPLPGAPDLLRACARHGLTVVLASSADPGEFAVLRAALGADDAVRDATSSADADQSKPAPDLVQIALDKAGVPAAEALFVGDSVWDMQACQQAGVTGIGVRTGGISEAELLEAGALRVYPGAAELLAGFPASLMAGRA